MFNKHQWDFTMLVTVLSLYTLLISLESNLFRLRVNYHPELTSGHHCNLLEKNRNNDMTHDKNCIIIVVD